MAMSSLQFMKRNLPWLFRGNKTLCRVDEVGIKFFLPKKLDIRNEKSILMFTVGENIRE